MLRTSGLKAAPLVMLMSSFLFAAADTVCHVIIGGDVLKIDGLTRNIPLSAVGIGREIGYVAPDITATDARRAIPAIVLLIDDSGSMMQNDKDANRYVVTGEILDEIYLREPQTRVAVVTFRNWLAWDWRENPLFRKISSPFAWNDSYFPLTPLDSVFSDGKRGIDKIKALFQMDQWKLLQAFHSDSTERTRPPKYDPQGNPLPTTQSDQGTDITLAFTAAKDALRNSATPRERQFVVFLSDGYHGGVDVEMESAKLDYINGVDIPATFTIFLGDSVKVPPEQLKTMIGNIRDNGYSSTNPRSDLWSIASSHDTLLELMQREILSQVYAPLKVASSARIGSIQAVEISENSITFEKPIPLDPDTTVLSLELTFPLSVEGGKQNRDTVIRSQVTFIRDADAEFSSSDTNFQSLCFLRELSLTCGSKPIESVIGNSQTALTAGFLLEGIAPVPAQTASVYAVPPGDSLGLVLAYGSPRFSGSFIRARTGDPDTGNEMLRLEKNGSIRIVWRNPDLPLDTVSKEYSVSPYDPVEITGAWYLDTDRDGWIDAISVATDRPVNELEFSNLSMDRLVLPPDRKLTFESVERVEGDRGFTIAVTQDRRIPPFTGGTGSDSLLVTDFEIGPYDDYIARGTYPIGDGMAPVIISAVYTAEKNGATLTVTFSETVTGISTETPFKFISEDGTPYTMRVEPSGNDTGKTIVFRVLEMNSQTGKPGVNDSLWIASSSLLSDETGNVQVEPNRKARLETEFPAIDFNVAAYPNPLRRSTAQSFSIPGFKTVHQGTVLAIEADFPVHDIRTAIDTVETRIYDIVGNVCASGLENKAVGNRWYIHWDGTNRHRRNVGNGAYCAVITITAIDKTKRSKHVRKCKFAFLP